MKKALTLVAPALGLLMIPQLLFFWLAPDAANRDVVYLLATGFSVLHVGLLIFLGLRSGVRRSAAACAVGTGIWLLALLVSTALLAVAATIRSTVFSLSLIAILYAAVMIPLICAIEPRSDEPWDHFETSWVNPPEPAYRPCYPPERPPKRASESRPSSVVSTRAQANAARTAVEPPTEASRHRPAPPPLPME